MKIKINEVIDDRRGRPEAKKRLNLPKCERKKSKTKEKSSAREKIISSYVQRNCVVLNREFHQVMN